MDGQTNQVPSLYNILNPSSLANMLRPIHQIYQLCKISHLAHLQTGETCYANATATILRATEARIIGRKIEPHEAIVQRLVAEYGSNGADTFAVLTKECKKKHLRCRYASAEEAETAINGGRTLIMIFHMSEKLWDDFSTQFRK
jgi:hypothetical protein